MMDENNQEQFSSARQAPSLGFLVRGGQRRTASELHTVQPKLKRTCVTSRWLYSVARASSLLQDKGSKLYEALGMIAKSCNE